MTNISVFQSLCLNISQHEAIHIPSPPCQERRAAVAAILRWRRHRTDIAINSDVRITTIEQFFHQPWVQQDEQGEAEILFMQRATRVGDRWSGHVSFVGGKNEPGENDQNTVEREVLEEIGIDLSSDEYIQLGKLNEREITSIKDNKLLMVLIPFVYLQVVPESPLFQLQESEVAAVQWVPLSFFLSTSSYPYRPITEQLSIVKLKKTNKWIMPLIRLMMGSVTFPAIDLPTSPEKRTIFRLWGLTMGMTRDIIELTQLNHNHLAFLKLTRSKPFFTRRDIGWLTTLITQLTIYSKRLLLLSSSSNAAIIDDTTSTISDDRAKMEWDKVYFASIRKAVLVAILLRLGFTSVIFTLIIKKLKSSK